MEDKSAAIFVAVGEYFSSYYTCDRFGSSSCVGGQIICVVLRACTRPELPLSYPIVNNAGEVICGTLEEAMEKRVPVWWMEGDAVAMCEDGATHTP
jgi:hypothetical protein